MEKQIKHTIEYEITETISSFKKISTWMNGLAIAILCLVLIKSYLWALVAIIILIFLKFKMDYQSGAVLDYYRKKNDIPNKTRIKEIKYAQKEKRQ